jgi:ABC-2 type transport system ATP-binding protein
MARGRIVADGSPAEIKAMTGVRTIRATVRNAADESLAGLAGVTGVERHGDRVVLACSDSDVAIRALLERFTDVREIEISGADLEQAFLQLTGDTEAAAA